MWSNGIVARSPICKSGGGLPFAPGDLGGGGDLALTVTYTGFGERVDIGAPGP